MKKIFLILLYTFLQFTCFCQKNLYNNAIAVYSFSHVRDTNNLSNVYREEMILLCTPNETKYSSYILFKSDSLESENANQNIYNNSTSTNRIGNTTFEQQLYFFSKNLHYVVKPWGPDTLLISEPIIPLNWSLVNERKSIGGFTCFKATCYFKGRFYTAWYCPEIAIKAGPWKLNGLPGLILEAMDDKEHVKFELLSFKNVEKVVDTKLPTGKQITPKEYEQVLNALLDNPTAYITMLMNSSSSGGSNVVANLSLPNNSNSADRKDKPKRKSKINNPIELDN